MKFRSYLRFVVSITLLLCSTLFSQTSVLTQHFSSETFPPDAWSISTISGFTLSCERSTLSSRGIGTGSAMFKFFYANSGDAKALISSTFSSLTATGTLRFDHAYATKNSKVDSLRLEYSTNSGTTWIRLRVLKGGTNGELATATSTNSYFEPTSSQWQTKIYYLPVGTNKLRFIAFSANGNNLYLDNISVLTATGTFLVLDSPNGGETISDGQYTIKWTSLGVPSVRIEFTSNGGTNWNTIKSAAPADIGEYIWTLPNIESTTCKILVRNTSNINMLDISLSNFSISNLLYLTHPNGGETFVPGDLESISWTSSSSVNLINIQYTYNGGNNWTTIASSVSANNGSINWRVPNTPSTDCKVRITSSNPSFLDISNSKFTISHATSLDPHEDFDAMEIPQNAFISQNYPNPFNPSTVLRYSIPQESKVTITVYNSLGEAVGMIRNEILSCGWYESEFRADNLPSGIYFAKLEAISSNNKFVRTIKMLLLK